MKLAISLFCFDDYQSLNGIYYYGTKNKEKTTNLESIVFV
jgi:hypothetical protein